MVVFSSCTNGGPSAPWEQWRGAPVVFTMLDPAYLAFLHQWSRRMDHFGIHQRFAMALRNETLIGREAARIGLPCLQATQREIAPFKTAALLDKLGQTLGESDTLVWRMAAHALKLLGSEARLLYHDMDVFWAGNPLRLLHHLHEPPGSVHCALNDRSKRGGRRCNIGLLAFHERSAAATKARHAAASEHPTLADSLICAAEKWRQEVIDAVNQERPPAAKNGQAMYNRIFWLRSCGFDRVEDEIPQQGSDNRSARTATRERITVHALPAEQFASNQPRTAASNPSWGNITRDETISLHLTAMCFKQGCGAEPNGAKVAVLHALYHKGVWPSSNSFIPLAEIHRPMVHQMVGPPGQPWDGPVHVENDWDAKARAWRNHAA